MALRNVLKVGDDLLRKKTKVVEKFDDNLCALLDDMYDTMQKNNGVGLAAPQVGILKKIVVMEINNAYFEMINPKIVEQSAEVVEDEEGCLSLPNQNGIVARPKTVTVQFQDRFGTPMTITGQDLFARCVCHELDHLEGILFVDKVLQKNKK